jgi:hypothetical protein
MWTAYDPTFKFGVDIDKGLFSINVQGSSELKGMTPEKTRALIVLLQEALDV